MLKIRLQRRGKNKMATYRVVVAEAHAPIKGRFIADLGSYNPHTKKMGVEATAVAEWIKKGAKPSNTLHNLFINHNIIKGEKVTIWQPPKSAETAAPATPEAAPEKPAAPETTEAK